MSKPPRVWVSTDKPKPGEVVRVRAQMEHIMESGLRRDEAGQVRPRNIVSLFEARLGNTLLFSWEPNISVAQNPYIEFTFVARESGALNMVWKDEAGQVVKADRTMTVG
ncbi:MAG: thiosulfate oxidation carrier complex protein SoxZ [Pigmentiphaga sp.]